MSKFVRFLKEQPTAIVGLLQAALGFLVALGVLEFTEAQTGAVLGVTAAVVGFVVGLTVRPFVWNVVTGLVQAGVLLFAEFGPGISDQAAAQLYTLVAVVGTIVMWFVNTPETKLEPVNDATATP